ncbi:GGDEF domain-containing protein, partial [Sulfurospirillum cavolei]|uniref:GGDEF domain-containing protein n=1 Tax=Sulfurospirillum cavolei TaxID=366522 RepID=UPI003FA22E4E
FIDTLRKERQTFGIVLLDINYFKEINDTYGHAFGDELLIGFVQTMQPALPKSACLGRLGGDEFIVVLRECHSYTVLEETMLTLKALLKKVYTINAVEITSSTSVGAALYPIDANDVEALIRLADERMYADKHKDHRIFNP